MAPAAPLGQLVAGAEVVATRGDLGTVVTGVAHDSRRVAPGDVFCCLVGEHADGHDHAPEAAARGAVALVVERPVPVDLPQVEVADARRAMALAADALHGHPSGQLRVVGVTGTNGKTTTTHLLAAVLDRCQVLGTLSGARTTPEAPDLQARLAGWRDEGVAAVAMEVSSHALALRRVDGVRFAAAVFTNLSRDHLDFHGTEAAYFEAKARLFQPDLTDLAVVNLDSPHGRLLRDASAVPTVGYSLDQATDLRLGPAGSTFTWRGHHVSLGLAGRFNVSNAMAAAEAAVALGTDPARVAAGLCRPVVVPGRFERVEAGQPFGVVVDYAHTPDGLEQVLLAGRELVGGAGLVVVFGCGGDRDPTKRPLMGAAAARLADTVVLTADNSRSEPTAAIIEAVRQGYEREPGRRARHLVVEPDRRAAIAAALARAEPGDLVVVAGKGHEATQSIGDRVEPFDDRVVAAEELARLAGEGGAP